MSDPKKVFGPKSIAEARERLRVAAELARMTDALLATLRPGSGYSTRQAIKEMLDKIGELAKDAGNPITWDLQDDEADVAALLRDAAAAVPDPEK